MAAAHHISLSYLHRLFETEATTVAAWIRHQRLERARHDLGDTTQRHIPVHAIAARWGFPAPPSSAGPSARPTACRPGTTGNCGRLTATGRHDVDVVHMRTRCREGRTDVFSAASTPGWHGVHSGEARVRAARGQRPGVIGARGPLR
ncbi:helix-turn-helix domain-containing protein [Streptomyces stramineus]